MFGDGYHVVAELSRQLSDPLALTADDQSDFVRQIRIFRVFTAEIARINPHIALFQLAYCVVEIGDFRDEHMLRRAACDLDHGVRHAHASAGGDDYAVRPETFRAAHNRAEIVRVGYAVEQDDEQFLSARFGTGENVVERGIDKVGNRRRHSLMIAAAAKPVQHGAVCVLHGHAVFLCLRKEGGQPRVALPFQKIYPVESLARAERFAHGISAVNQHCFSSSSAAISRKRTSLSVCPVR